MKALHKRSGKGAVPARPKGNFDLRFHKEKLPEYNPLHDHNLRHFFEAKHVQTHLYANGLIDANGRVINLEKNKSKLHIIEQEFKAAERSELWRRKEEEEFRHRVQQKRYETLEKIKQRERLQRVKEGRLIRQQILAASRSALGVPDFKKKLTKKSDKKKKAKRATKERATAVDGAQNMMGNNLEEKYSEQGFFMTGMEDDSSSARHADFGACMQMD